MRVLLLFTISLLGIGETLSLGQGQTGDQIIIRSAPQNPHTIDSEKINELNAQIKMALEILKGENSLNSFLTSMERLMDSRIDNSHCIEATRAQEIAKIEQINEIKSKLSIIEMGIKVINERTKEFASAGYRVHSFSSLLSELSENNKAIREIKEQISAQRAKPVEHNGSGSCYDVMQNTSFNGVYKIKVPNVGIEPFDVFCKDAVEYGTGWTVVLRRNDGSEDFDRSWSEYKNGFGNLSGEFFIGLDKLHAMTTAGKPQELLILLKGINSTTMRYAKYEEFAIGDENEAYKLNVLGDYTGDAGNSMRYHLNMKFSTKDAQNDGSGKNACAVLYHGGWWFDSCYHCHLTGRYLDTVPEDGVGWNSVPEEIKNMIFAEMMIRSRIN